MSTDIARTAPTGDKLFMRYVLPAIAPLALRLSPNGFARTPAKSASDVLLAAFDVDKLGEYPKAVYLGGNAPEETSEEARDIHKQKQLWKETLKYVSIGDGDTVLKNWA
jgi:hypothetical protein